MSEMPIPGTVPLRAPDSSGTAPDRIRLHPDARTYSPPAAIRRPFRRNFLDRKDPFEASGHPINSFTFSNSYDLEGTPPQEVADEIHERLQRQLADGNLADTSLEVVDFEDASVPGEPARRFFVTHTTTRRKTVVTVNAYMRPYGDHLYYSVRSYVLPMLNIWKLLLAAVIILAALRTATELGSIALLFVVVGLVVYLRNFIIDVAAGEPVIIALRKQFPGGVNAGTFDDDDMMAFLKTNVSLTLNTIATVLEKHGIDTGGLRMFVQKMETYQVNTGGGSIIGAAIGGIANRIAAEVRT